MGIQHFYIAVEKEEWKLDTLCDLIETLTDSRLVIYCNTRTKAEYVHREMTRRDFSLALIHADLEQRERDLVMREFNSGIATHLVCTLPVQTSGNVLLNFDMPHDAATYRDRVALGYQRQRRVSLNFVTISDVR